MGYTFRPRLKSRTNPEQVMDGRGDSNRFDLYLIHGVMRRQRGTWEAFVRRFSDIVYSRCAEVFSTGEADSQYLNVFRELDANNFAILARLQWTVSVHNIPHF